MSHCKNKKYKTNLLNEKEIMSILLSNGDRFTIKLTCHNLPYIDFADEAVPENISNRIYLRKADIVAIIKEMQEFVDYHAEDFSAENVNTTHEEE